MQTNVAALRGQIEGDTRQVSCPRLYGRPGSPFRPKPNCLETARRTLLRARSNGLSTCPHILSGSFRAIPRIQMEPPLAQCSVLARQSVNTDLDSVSALLACTITSQLISNLACHSPVDNWQCVPRFCSGTQCKWAISLASRHQGKSSQLVVPLGYSLHTDRGRFGCAPKTGKVSTSKQSLSIDTNEPEKGQLEDKQTRACVIS